MKSNALLNDLKVAAVLEENSNSSLIHHQCVVPLRNIKSAVNKGYEGSCRAVDWQDIAAVIMSCFWEFGGNCLLFG